MTNTRFRIHILAALMAAALILSASASHAKPKQVPQKVNAVMVGDRLIDVAYNLGFVPEGMSLRCSLWPMCKALRETSQVLGCPKCVSRKRPKTIPKFMADKGIKRLIIETGNKFCLYVPDLKLKNIAKLVKDKDVTVEFVDFSKGLPQAIRDTAKLLGVPEKADELIAKYKKAFDKAKAAIPADMPQKRVVVINGIHQPSTGKSFMRVEAPGGYSDQYMLAPLNCVNVGRELSKSEPNVSKGHFMFRNLGMLKIARPDVIVMTGDAFAVQAALHKAIAKNPALADVPAIKNSAVFSLPLYVDSGVIEYPAIFNKWRNALRP